MTRLYQKDLPIGTRVSIAERINFRDASLNKAAAPFNTLGAEHTVTGHHHGGDVYLDGGAWSVSPYRLALVVEEPQTGNSVLDFPRCTVLAYHLQGEREAAGVVYPYVVRTLHSVWLWDKHKGRWVNVAWERIPYECPWVLDIGRAWSKEVFVELVEAFEYPRLPAVVEQLQQEILHNA